MARNAIKSEFRISKMGAGGHFVKKIQKNKKSVIIIIIIICRNRHSFNVAGCLIRGRRRWSVTYTSPRGPRISEFFRIWNRRAFQERKPYQFPGWMKNSPYYCPGRGANPRPPAHPDFITSKESHTLLVRP